MFSFTSLQHCVVHCSTGFLKLGFSGNSYRNQGDGWSGQGSLSISRTECAEWSQNSPLVHVQCPVTEIQYPDESNEVQDYMCAIFQWQGVCLKTNSWKQRNFRNLKTEQNNFPFQPTAPASPNTQQHNVEPAVPNFQTPTPPPSPVFAPNITATLPHAPLINQPPVHNTFQNKINRVHQVVRSVASPVPNIPNIPLAQQFVPTAIHCIF